MLAANSFVVAVTSIMCLSWLSTLRGANILNLDVSSCFTQIADNPIKTQLVVIGRVGKNEHDLGAFRKIVFNRCPFKQLQLSFLLDDTRNVSKKNLPDIFIVDDGL